MTDQEFEAIKKRIEASRRKPWTRDPLDTRMRRDIETMLAELEKLRVVANH